MTDPTADAAKLWLDQFVQPNLGDHSLNAEMVRAAWPIMAEIVNTRPQPAPPEGEPDFDRLVDDLEHAWVKASLAGDPLDRSTSLVRGAYRLGLAARPKVEGGPLSQAQIEYMRDRFLGWRLPENFSPDAGISFKPTFNDHLPTPTKHNPTGTNLFDVGQAEAMVRYIVEDMPGLAAWPKVEDTRLVELCNILCCGDLGSSEQPEVADLLERLLADLHTKETQLAQADAWIEMTAGIIANSGLSFEQYNEITEIARKRHAAHQQAASGKPVTSR